MKNELEVVEKIANSKLAQRVYDDGLSLPILEISKLGVDVVKTARLFLAPLQIAASFQNRFEVFLNNLNKRVKEDNLVQPPAELTSSCIEKMKYIDSISPLWMMFEELLIKASDKNTISTVHPSFGQIIGQLSPDEAFMIYELSKNDFEVTDTLDLNRTSNRFENRKILNSTIPTEKLANSGAVDIYYSHLDSLSLVIWPVIHESAIMSGNNQTGTKRKSKMQLTDFGRLFAKACIPINGFQNS